MQNNNQSKYYRLSEYIKEEILMGRIKPGEKDPFGECIVRTIFVESSNYQKGSRASC